MKSHMQHPDNPNRTRCGQLISKINFHPIVHGYGSKYADCKTCLRLHAKDMAKVKPGLPRKYYKCARTDCGVAGCECSSLDPEPPEFCVYDNDEAHWDEIKRGDDQ